MTDPTPESVEALAKRLDDVTHNAHTLGVCMDAASTLRSLLAENRKLLMQSISDGCEIQDVVERAVKAEARADAAEARLRELQRLTPEIKRQMNACGFVKKRMGQRVIDALEAVEEITD